MADFAVHIVLSDEGWILEKLAEKLKSQLGYVNYDLDVDGSADIQYYMTYATQRYKVSPREMGYFAHIEQDEGTKQKFFDVAKSVDFCVCHSTPYEDMLREAGVENVRTVSPGVDLEVYTPLVKIGVVGRTYHTGRKGEHLVAAVMDIPGIEWHFTGSGWPGPAKFLTPEEMPSFYRSMNYILVPSLYEGGPMSVVEALACGCEVIAPPVGWVPQFPHIEYKTGDADDLRRVLMGVVAKRAALRETVLARSWDGWVDGHREVFEQLAASIPPRPRLAAVKGGRLGASDAEFSKIGSRHRVGLALHGSEDSDRGGPSTRVPRLAIRLSRAGMRAEMFHGQRTDPRNYDLVHVFNVWHPRTCQRVIDTGRLANSAIVLSPIYLDLSEKSTFDRTVSEIFRNSHGYSTINGEFARVRERRQRQVAKGAMLNEAYPGYFSDVCELVKSSDHLICLSETERTALRAIGADVSHSSIVKNPVEAELYAQATPDLFVNRFGISDYVLCVGRLEPRKNQITLLHALRNLPIPIVLVGHASRSHYETLLHSAAGDNARFVGWLPMGSPLLASAYAGARVFILPSWSEGAPLSALEAAAAGCRMVLSNRSSEREYFGDRARYIDPCDPEDIAAKVVEAYESRVSGAERESLKSWVAEEFSWERHVGETVAAYTATSNKPATQRRPTSASMIYVDLTSSAHRAGPPSGIARVEHRYALELYRMMPDRVRFVLWNSHYGVFVNVSYREFMSGKFKDFSSELAPAFVVGWYKNRFMPYAQVQFLPSSILVVLGGAWIRNSRYIQSLTITKRATGVNIIVFIHDTIQVKFRHWFPDKVGDEFANNCAKMIEIADHVIVNSQCTRNDTMEFCEEQNLLCPLIDAVRFGDEIDDGEAIEEDIQFDQLPADMRNKPFVLCVSALDIRKNHILLYNIWERMISEHAEKVPNLVMVGSKGWSIEPFLEMVSRNKRLKGSFHILHDINDATLSWLYRNCLFTVYPSFYEGWGLPVAESLGYQKVCVAARAGAVPEIAPELTDLLDPLDFVTWYRTISSYAFNPESLRRRQERVRDYRPVTWRESTNRLVAILDKFIPRPAKIPSLKVGDEVDFRNDASKEARFERYSLGGWYNAELAGCWTAGSTAQLQFRLEGQLDRPLSLTLTGRGFRPSLDRLQRIEVACSGHLLGKVVWGEARNTDMLIIPTKLINQILQSGPALLELRIAEPMSPASLSQSRDSRLLGAMLEMLKFEVVHSISLGSWVGPASNQVGGAISPALQTVSTPEGGIAYRILLYLDEEAIAALALTLGDVYLGCRFSLTAEAAGVGKTYLLSVTTETGRLGECEVDPNDLVTKYFPIPIKSVIDGIVVNIKADNADTLGLEIIELGLFETLPGQHALELVLETVVDCVLPTVATGVRSQLASHWMLPRRQLLDRQLAHTLFFSGWSGFEGSGVWSDGDASYLSIRPHIAERRDYLLSLEVTAYQPGKVEMQINGSERGEWIFRSTQPQQRFITIEAADLRQDVLLIRFRFENAISPHALSGDADKRRLGILLSSIALLERPKMRASQGQPSRSSGVIAQIDMSQMPLRTLATMDGWYPPEPAMGCWTAGRAGSVCLQTCSSFEGAGRLVGVARMLGIEAYGPQSVEVRVNGMLCGSHSFHSDGMALIDLPVAPRVLADVVPLTVDFESSNSVLPAQLGYSDDTRVIGVLIRSFAIVPAEAKVDLAELLPGFVEIRHDGTTSAPSPNSIPAALAASVVKTLSRR